MSLTVMNFFWEWTTARLCFWVWRLAISVCFPLKYQSTISKHLSIFKTMFNNLAIRSEILKYWGLLWAPRNAYCTDHERERRKEQKKKDYLPFFSPVCFSSDMSTPFSCKEAIETQDSLGVFCLSTARDKRRSV